MTLISPGQLIDRTWEHFRAHTSELLSISGWVVVTAILDVIALAFYPNASKLLLSGSLTNVEIFGSLLFFVSTAIVTPVIGLWVLGALVRMLRGQMGEGRVTSKDAMREGRKWFWPVVLVSVQLQLVMLAGVVIGFAPSMLLLALAWITKNNTLSMLGNMLLVFGTFASAILCIRWFVQFVMAPYALLLEGKRGKEALLRSKELVKGRFFGVLVRYALPKLFFILIGIVCMTLITFAVNVLISGAAGLNTDAYLRLTTIVNTVIPILLTALLNPLITIGDVLLYNSLKGR